MRKEEVIKEIEEGKIVLGIEFGSTRIKAVMIASDYSVIAQGNHKWENKYEDSLWTYSLEDVWSGLQDCYSQLMKNVRENYEVTVQSFAAIGFSAMMHGYLVFDKEEKLLVPFRTWRNNITKQAAQKLSKLFQFNIPERWSIAHLYQAVLNDEEHVPDISFQTTLAGYIHYKLTGQMVVGIGEASGMFPIDSKVNNYNNRMKNQFEELISEKGFSWKLSNILPKVMVAGENAGILTEEGAKLIDVSGNLKAGIPLCPPEGDAGTGMVATNSVAIETGNVSAGTSVFAMVVLKEELKNSYSEIDIVTTPTGKQVAMVHCNNCTSDLNAWINIFKEFSDLYGVETDMEQLFAVLYNQALKGDEDCGKLLAYNYFSGESITNLSEGRPLFIRMPDSRFTLANFMRTHLFTALGALKLGLDILFKEEGVTVKEIIGHGGFFKTKDVGQKIMAASINVPVTCMETAGEGGAWGMAILAAYMIDKKDTESLDSYLSQNVFKGEQGNKVLPNEKDVKGFELFIERYKKGLMIEQAAVKVMQD